MANQKPLHIAMNSWFAIGHLTAFLHTANKLASKGHRISFFLPKNTSHKLQHLNLHPNLISFIPINVPHINGLPSGSETTHDIPLSLTPLLFKSLDLTKPFIEASLKDLKPHFIFYDFQHWMPKLAHSLKIKAFMFSIGTPVSLGYLLRPEKKSSLDEPKSDYDITVPPRGFPPSNIRIKLNVLILLAQLAAAYNTEHEEQGISLPEKTMTAFNESDAIIFKSFREMEGPYIDYLERQFEKPVYLTGPVLPKPPPNATLEERWEKWLGGFSPKSVIYCAFGSECILNKDQFQELILGLELTGMPFIAALKPPVGAESIESALPEGFNERVKGRGIVHGGWVQQLLILNHPSVGCFLNHCGATSMTEALCSEAQMVLIPNFADQFVNSQLLCEDLKVAVEVERGDEDGFFTKESVCKAVRLAMDSDSEIGQTIRCNHNKWRQTLLAPRLEDAYLDDFVQELRSQLIN